MTIMTIMPEVRWQEGGYCRALAGSRDGVLSVPVRGACSSRKGKSTDIKTIHKQKTDGSGEERVGIGELTFQP